MEAEEGERNWASVAKRDETLNPELA